MRIPKSVWHQKAYLRRLPVQKCSLFAIRMTKQKAYPISPALNLHRHRINQNQEKTTYFLALHKIETPNI